VNDTRFDGKRIFAHGSASQAVYEIRGKYIYNLSSNWPLYEIRGDCIHKANSTSGPIYEIRGQDVHKYMRALPVYEIR